MHHVGFKRIISSLCVGHYPISVNVFTVGQGLCYASVTMTKPIALMDQNWDFVLSMFPTGWESIAWETKAVQHFKGEVKSLPDLMRIFFLHIANGYSLTETVTRSELAGLGKLSSVALMNRLRSSEELFRQMALALIAERGVQAPEVDGINIKLIDGTNVKEPGKTGSQWRVHYALTLPELQCDHFELTSTKGSKTGETFAKFPVSPNDCFIGDRGYSRAGDVEYVHQRNGYVLIRHNPHMLPLYSDEKAFDVLNALSTLKEPGQEGAWNVFVRGEDGLIPVRLCVIRKEEEAAQKAVKKLHRKASKNQTELKPQTLEFAKYIMMITTLPKEKWPLEKVLELYRFRWQVELGFKRFKSLAQFGHLPKSNTQSSKAWLYAKLFICLLTEKLVAKADSFSPWEPICIRTTQQFTESVA